VTASSERRGAGGLEDRGKPEALSAGRSPPSPLRITVRAEYYSLVPFTLDTRTIFLPPDQLAGASGSFAEGFELSDPLRSGQSVLLDFGSPAGKMPGASALDAPEGEGQAWLQLPARLSPRLRELAALLADPGGEPGLTLRNIERYLAEHCTYNLEAPRLPAGADFVDTFLFNTTEGYCVHFATSFAVLARLNGIPTRYATGFLVTGAGPGFPLEGPRAQGRRTVTGLSSHAWPEVLLNGRGWVAWEATTAVNPAYYHELGDDWRYEQRRVENRLTDRQLRAILGRELRPEKRSGGRATHLDPHLLVPVLPAAALLAAVLWALRRYGVLLVAAVSPGRRSALRLVAKIVSSRSRNGVEELERCGWRRWVESAFPGSPGRGSAGGRLLRVIEEMMYADRGIGKREVRFLRAFYLRRCLSAPRREHGQ